MVMFMKAQTDALRKKDKKKGRPKALLGDGSDSSDEDAALSARPFDASSP